MKCWEFPSHSMIVKSQDYIDKIEEIKRLKCEVSFLKNMRELDLLQWQAMQETYENDIDNLQQMLKDR
jgi:hypothetical protein